MRGTPRYDIPDEVTEAPYELLHAVREGRAEAVPKLSEALTVAERRTCLPVLKSWRSSLRRDWANGHSNIRVALLAAGAACSTGAAAAAQWLASNELRWAMRDPTPVVETLADRDPEWLGQVAHRLAGRRTVAREEYPLISRLVSAANCAPPTTDGFVLGWEEACSGVAGEPVGETLRKNPFLTVMIPRLFEVPQAGSHLQDSWEHDPGWAAALAGFAREGLLSREALLDGCLSRLSRETRLGLVKGFLALLTALDPTEDEQAAHTPTWVRMVPDAHGLVVARAQETLAGLDAAGRLEAEYLIEASEAALTRPEKKIVRAQLTLLDKAVKRGGPDTDALLRAAAVAFGHEEHSLQERALALVVRHRKRASDAVLAELAQSAGQLGPDLRARAADALGEVLPDEGAGTPPDEGDGLPPAPEPERLAPVPPTAAELAEEVGVLMHGTDEAPGQAERVLNGLVVHAHADLPGLRAALQPVVGPLLENWITDYRSLGWYWRNFVVIAFMGGVPQEELDGIRRLALDPSSTHSAGASVLAVRVAEIATRLHGDPLPFLLATPTWTTGTLDPAELVERLAAYERSGTEPGPADLDQALLRLDRAIPPDAVTAAAKLTSPAGRRLAARLAEGALPDPATSRERERLRLRNPLPGVLVRTEAVAGREDFSEPFRSLLGAHDPFDSPDTGRHMECTPESLALLPQHREVVAARMLVTFAAHADWNRTGDGAPVLPALAESGGPAGPATHLLVAYGLGARRADEQLYAVDALLLLAARGALDAARLGGDIAELTGLRRLTLQRVVSALREVARAGAYATVWAVLSAALPALLQGGAPHALPAALILAADCAEGCGARGTLPPEIDALAARTGSSQTVKQARRIKNALERTA
jgi:hypothetical protein